MTGEQIGAAIKARRKVLKVDQVTVAELSDTSVPTLSRIETGRGNPTLDVLLRIFDVLGLELAVGVREVNLG